MCTKIEDLAVELWFDIFAYLNVCDQFEAFFKLNKRLDQIVIASRTAVSCKDNDEKCQYLLQHVLPHLTHREYVTRLRLENTNKMDLVCHAELIDFPRLDTLILRRLNITGPFLRTIRRNLSHLQCLTMTHQVSVEKRTRQALLEMILSLPNLHTCRLHSRIGLYSILPPTATSTSIRTLRLTGTADVCFVNRLISILQRLPSLQALHITTSVLDFNDVKNRDGSVRRNLISALTLDVRSWVVSLAQLTEFIATSAPCLEELTLVSHTPFPNDDYLDYGVWSTFVRLLPQLRKVILGFQHTDGIREVRWKQRCRALTTLLADNYVDLRLV